MSNRRRPANQPAPPDRNAWLLCPDCASQVHEVWYGQPPRLVLIIEVEHSETCPAWRQEGRELGVAFLPPDDESTEAPT
ncbi:MAG: hypothetical protein ACR2JU_00105 [Nocardioidaceae bacterium]